MRSDAFEGIIAMLRRTAAERGDRKMTVVAWRAADGGLGHLLPLSPGTEVTGVDAGGVAVIERVAP